MLADDTELGKQRDLSRLAGTPWKFGKGRVPYPAWSNPMLQDELGPACLKSSFAGKDFTDELNMREQRAPAMKRDDCVAGLQGQECGQRAKGIGSSPL